MREQGGNSETVKLVKSVKCDGREVVLKAGRRDSVMRKK